MALLLLLRVGTVVTAGMANMDHKNSTVVDGKHSALKTCLDIEAVQKSKFMCDAHMMHTHICDTVVLIPISPLL